jgi:4-amino-4-deoxy-L-arabinose transferase-like glycosyltransferase
MDRDDRLFNQTRFLLDLRNRFSGRLLQRTIAVILLLFAILLPRVIALDRLVTPDETRWLTRSANFYYALTHRDFAHTYQIEHPGVVVMWAGMFALMHKFPEYGEQAQGQLNWLQDEIGDFLRERGYDPLELLVASRLNMVLAITGLLIAAFWTASRLLGFWPAMVGFFLIAVDPFHVALSRLLHVDGMSSTLMFLSILAYMCYLYRGGHVYDLVLSGAAAGLAWLTKTPSLFLIPFLGLVVLLTFLEKSWQQRQIAWKDLWRLSFPFVIWGGIGLMVLIVLWPAMWVEPIHTIRRMLGGTVSYAVEGHDFPLYFNGKVYTGDPGIQFYPVTYLWRTTPTVLIGILFAGMALFLPQKQWLQPSQRRPLVTLLLFAILFTLFMDLGAKKFDRYLLPVYPPLAVVAGVGWMAAANWVRQRRPQRRVRQVSAVMVLLTACAGQAACTLSSYPYYLSFYNPLLGGTPRAPQVMMVGWGEGLDQAARLLNSQPGASHRQVATGVWSTTFSYYYKGPVLRSRFEAGTNRIEDWMASDYYVMYINESQRDKVSYELIDYFATQEPLKVVYINGLDYVYIYDIRGLPPPDFME